MPIRTVTLKYSAERGEFDDSKLQEILRGRTSAAVRDHFFEVNGVPHLLCLVSWAEEEEAAAASARAAPAPAGPLAPRERTRDAAEGLTPEQKDLFERLRGWRRKQAESEGAPPYVLFTNRQFREIVLALPRSKAALLDIAGVGRAKIDRYGATVLEIIQGTATPKPAEAAAAEPGSDARNAEREAEGNP